MSDKTSITLEENKRFSESMLWKIQREYYHQQGVEAWVEQVPFYITSNPFIANGYAQLVVRFIQDWVNQHKDAINHPFYIVELGAGTGQFGYYVVKYLAGYLEKLRLENISVKYVMTDFTENNVEFWKTHPALQSYIKSGLLDFAIFDFENDQSIRLVHSDKILEKNAIHNPMVVFANYLFDTVTSDVFSVNENEITESVVSLSTPAFNFKNDKLVDYKKLKLFFNNRPIGSDYYSDEILDEMLSEYQAELKSTSFLFPIGGLRGIQNILNIANNKLLLISSDKGYTQPEELENLDYPELDFHGSFSTMVNFDAIARYFKKKEGDCFLQTPRDGLVTAIFASGFKFNHFTEMSIVLDRFVEGLSPTDYFNFYEILLKTYKMANIHTLASYLCLSRWDPFILDEINDRIELLLERAEQQVIDYLASNMHKIAGNFYFIPNCNDTLFSIGVFYQTIDQFEKAIEYFKLSEKYFGSDFALFYNYGLCYFYSEKYDLARKYLQRAHEIKPKDKDVKEMLNKSERKLEGHVVK